MRIRAALFEAWAWLAGPLAMGVSTVLVVERAARWPLSTAGLVLFFASVLTAYAYDRWGDWPPAERPAWALAVSVVAIVTALTAAAFLPLAKIAVAVALGVAGLFYRQLKKFPLGKTLLIALAWPLAAISFTLQPGAPVSLTLPVGGAIFILFASGALLCDFKDLANDARHGVCTAPVLLGVGWASTMAAGLALAGAAMAVVLGRPGLVGAGLALAVLAAFPKTVSRPVLGPILVDGALALPAVFILTGLA